jgi:hypothetical protein
MKLTAIDKKYKCSGCINVAIYEIEVENIISLVCYKCLPDNMKGLR